MPERSFMDIWSLGSDEITWVDGFNRSSRVWAAFQLCFYRQHGRFPSRDGDIDDEGLRYLAEQLGLAVPDPAGFRFDHVNARRQRYRQVVFACLRSDGTAPFSGRHFGGVSAPEVVGVGAGVTV